MNNNYKMTDKDRMLIEDNYPFIIYYIHHTLHIQDEDIAQSILYRLCIAIKTYDESQGKITTFIAVVLNNALKSYKHLARARKYDGYTVSLDAPLDTQSDDATLSTYGDIIASQPTSEWHDLTEKELAKDISYIINNTPIFRKKRNYEICTRYFLLGQNQLYLAAHYNISPQRIGQMTLTCKRVLMKALSSERYGKWNEDASVY